MWLRDSGLWIVVVWLIFEARLFVFKNSNPPDRKRFQTMVLRMRKAELKVYMWDRRRTAFMFRQSLFILF